MATSIGRALMQAAMRDREDEDQRAGLARRLAYFKRLRDVQERGDTLSGQVAIVGAARMGYPPPDNGKDHEASQTALRLMAPGG